MTTEFTTALDGPKIVKDGGMFKAGLIENFAVITPGPARGHGMWVDEQFTADVASQLSSTSIGVTARATHPKRGDDGLFTTIGRVIFRSYENGQVRGDLHFYKAAADISKFLLQLAEEDPTAYGASISFTRDAFAEVATEPNNPENFPHVRLNELKHVDIVGVPAANPEGLLSSAENLVTGLQTTEEEPMKLNIPQNEKALNEAPADEAPVEEVPADEAPADEAPADEAPADEAPADEAPAEEAPAEEAPAEEAPKKEKKDNGHFKEDLGKYVEQFGKEKGVDYFMGELGFEAAQADFISFQSDTIKTLRKELELANQSVQTPLSSNDGEVKPKGKGLASNLSI